MRVGEVNGWKGDIILHFFEQAVKGGDIFASAYLMFLADLGSGKGCGMAPVLIFSYHLSMRSLGSGPCAVSTPRVFYHLLCEKNVWTQ